MAKKNIQTEITIHATPQKIWNILTDFTNYPNWNPFITSFQGNAFEGNTVVVKIKPPEGSQMIFKPTIVERKENIVLRWKGKLLFSGLFDGTHHFELIDNHNGTTTFMQREEFEGIFVGLFNPQKTQNGFEAMNKKLKELAERN